MAKSVGGGPDLQRSNDHSFDGIGHSLTAVVSSSMGSGQSFSSAHWLLLNHFIVR
jgi:hypothetical protein